MLTCWLLQGSLLVAPMTMGDAPPETRSIALAQFRAGEHGEGQKAAIEWKQRAQSGHEFEDWVRGHTAQSADAVATLYGTFWRERVNAGTAQFLFSAEIGEVGGGDLERASESYLVAKRLERDAACRQILVAGTDQTARAKADALVRELKAGADFAKLARDKSDDRASALRGGDLAIYERGPEDALLREAAFNAAVGEIVGPIASPLGFHILQRVPVEQLDPRLRDDTWAHARAILVAFNSAVGADPGVTRSQPEAKELAEALAARILRGEEMSKVASDFNDDRGGRERAGDLGWIRRATTRMPQFFDKLFIEPPGTLIGPLPSNAGFLLLRREDPGPRSRIDLRKSAFVDLEQWVRKLAEAKTEPPAVDGLVAAVAAARALDASFGAPTEWGRIEGDLPLSPSAADFVSHCAELPENVTTLSGRPAPLRELASAYAKSLEELEPRETTDNERRGVWDVWTEHERTIDAAIAALKPQIGVLGDVALDELMRGLGMNDPRVVVPVYLVAEGPWPGGVTHRANVGGVCLIDADENKGSQLLEIVLHESSHALDISTQGQDTALNALRKRMADAGIDRRDRAMRDVPHTLMFVTSAWVVRHVFDAAHKDYGDVAGYYAKVPAATEAVRGPWIEFLEGKKTREEALDAIVDSSGTKK